MKELDVLQMMSAVMTHPNFKNLTSIQRKKLKESIDQIPLVFSDILDSKLTYANLMVSRCRYASICFRIGLIPEISNTPATEDDEAMESLIKSIGIEVMPLLENILVVNYAKLLIPEKIVKKMNDQVFKLYKEGTLTVLDVLNLQPLLIISGAL